ncbi:MAG: hypothetical protein PWP23_1139 [Candidatus Sumerlaeota bacterium]|nr:hypothetical protein [Candidatus Sumerlaeota bacterium]
MLDSILKDSLLTGYDLIVILFYFSFMFGVGFVFHHFNKDASDYFRGGGKMLWWMVGATAFMTQFSAWTFTGAAGKAYQDGSLVAWIFIGNALGFFGNYLYMSYRFRRMRVITAVEGVRDRFGAVNEQLFTWMQVPISIAYAGIWLNGLAIVAASFFGLDMEATIWTVGIVVVVMSVAGGSWAIVASDFIQLLLLMAIAIVTAILALGHPAIGGIGGFLDKVPAHHFNWRMAEHSEFVYFWIITALIVQTFKLNNMYEGYRYLCVKNDKHAKWAALTASLLMLIGPVIWFIPPMAARIVQPDLASVFPELGNPAEGAYIFMGMQTLPVGMLGLLACGLFAATVSSMDSGLNRNAGIFVKNFYQPLLMRKATGGHLLLVGKITSAIFGILIILAALYINQLEDMPLFDIMIQFGSLIAVPFAAPLVLGMIIKRTPAWSAWSTVLVGFAFSLFLKKWFNLSWIGLDDLSSRGKSDFDYIVSGIGNIVICSGWFFMTIAFHRYAPAKYVERVEEFFQRLATPVTSDDEPEKANDARQSNTLAVLCYVYGGFILLLAVFVPNSMGGRLSYVFCGSLIAGVGAALHYVARKGAKKNEEVQDRPA